MTRFLTRLVPALALLSGALAYAQSPTELPQLFPRRAELEVKATGLQSIELPLEVVRACRPGLSDLRLWADGQEVPYLIDSTGPAPAVLGEKLDAKVTRVLHDRSAPLCQRNATTPRTAHCETYDLSAPPAGEGWEIVFEIAAAQFAERIEMTADQGAPVTESIFRLPGPGERVRLPMPKAIKRITLTMLGDGPPLSPKLRYERGTAVRGADLVDDSLSSSESWRDKLGTHLLLDRPIGVLPTALRFSTATGAFDRKVQIYDHTSVERRTLIGEGRVTRVAVNAGNERIAIEQLDVPIGVPRARKLEVVFDDGDSPRLGELAVRAVLLRPILLFNRDSIGTVELLFGGGRVDSPRYDLQQLLPVNLGEDGAEGVRAQLAARLRERDGVSRATLGALGSNPRYSPTPVLASVAHAGAAIELPLWSSARPIEIAPSPDGLSRYVLAPADLAALRSDLGDVRIVDAQGRQWPYVLDREVDAQLVELAEPKAGSQGGSTRYELTLPAAPIPVGELIVDAQEGFFDRALVVVARDPAGRERRIEGLRLARTMGEKDPIVVRFGLPDVGDPRVASLALLVTDGGDAPLHLGTVRVRVPTAALMLAATKGSYRLVAGNPEAEPPTYELASLGSLFGQLDAAEVKAGALAANPSYSSAARLRAGGGPERVLVWLALGLAVVVLGVLTLRMARTEQGPPA